MAATTKHTCGGPVFGHKTPGCPRCDELLAGAAPVQWKRPTAYEVRTTAQRHDCQASGCGVVCTHGDW